MLATIPPKPEPTASSKYAKLVATRADMAHSASHIRIATTKSPPESKQNMLRQATEVRIIGTGSTNSPGTVCKMILEARIAHIVGSRLTATRHSSTAVARRALSLVSAKPLLRLQPAAVQKSQMANTMPSEISLPLKTTMSSRMRTICPMTALNPTRVRAAVTEDFACAPRGVVIDRKSTRLNSSHLGISYAVF